ncbi:MAG: DNA mismatch repair protein MutS [Bergeyella sp.]|nr:DNA mismatch repair protein MutS [Bergeyella sp.]
MKISRESLEELEFPQLLEEIVPYACSKKTIETIQNLRPLPEATAVEALKKTSEYLKSYQSENYIPFHPFEDIDPELKRLEIENFRLEADSFMRIKNITKQIGELQKFFRAFCEIFPILSQGIKSLTYKKEIIQKIEAVFNRFGEVKNDASPDLKILRENLQKNKKELLENFERSLGFCLQQDLLDEIRESVIEDQRVLAVKSVFKKRVGGRVLGISNTGSITFIQPESVITSHNELRELQEKEKNEVDKILRKLTAEISVFTPFLASYQGYIEDLDVTRAKAKFAEKINGVFPKINARQTLKLYSAFHPLLFLRNKEEKKEIFPQALSLSSQERILCISGPNAGGKSVTLKTVGLLQIMLQSGILVPVHPKSEMFFYGRIMTDIGDNQSIENHLSTYSSRLKKMSRMIEETDENTLLLIDEFGTGSDPELGGALAESFLEFFYEKKCFSIITTHYTNIKLRIEQLLHAENAAMLFDKNTLEPLYKLEVGQAGSSFTFEVAEKNNIPEEIISAAKKKVERREVVDLDRTIVKLQQEKYEVEKLKYTLTESKGSVESKRENLKRLGERLENKLYNFQRLYDAEQKKLQWGSKVALLIDQYAEGRHRRDVLGEFIKLLEQEKYKKREQINNPDKQKELRLVKKKIDRQLRKENIREKFNEIQDKKLAAQKKERQSWLKVGARVRIKGSASVGTIDRISKNKVVINYGAFKTTISENELERV